MKTNGNDLKPLNNYETHSLNTIPKTIRKRLKDCLNRLETTKNYSKNMKHDLNTIKHDLKNTKTVKQIIKHY